MDDSIKRRESLARLDLAYQRVRDRLLPADGSGPSKDGRFWELEALADEFSRAVSSVFLEELAGLSAHARVDQPGCCPHCQSANTKWLDDAGQRERRSKHGPVVLPRQVARCRSCDRSFSPSGAGVAIGPAGGIDAAGGRAGVPGVGLPAV